MAFTDSVIPLPDDPDGRDKGVAGSASVLFRNGVSTTVSGGFLDAGESARDRAYYYYGKLGLKRPWFNFGDTAVSLDYGHYRNFAGNGDKGGTYSLVAVQKVQAWNFSIYAGGRCFELVRPGEHYKNVIVAFTGGLYRF